ncbi:unnamed protein product [Brassica rapa subsp. trilocularis]
MMALGRERVLVLPSSVTLDTKVDPNESMIWENLKSIFLPNSRPGKHMCHQASTCT